MLLIIYASVALGISFLCSMLEASLLSIPSSHVALLVERGSKTGRRLQKMKEQVDRPLSAILTLNTIAHTVGAVGVGAEAARIFGDGAVGIVSGVMTLLILVLSEIIPKTIGAVYAKSLAGFTTVTTRAMMIMTWPIIVVLQWASLLIGRGAQTEPLTRGELIAVARLGHQAGSLDTREYQMISNLMSLDAIKIDKILTPRTVLQALPEDQLVDDVMNQYTKLSHARIPIYRESVDNVTGYVTRFDLTEACQMGKGDLPLSTLARAIHTLPEQASVRAALDQMLSKHEHIMIVVDEYGGLEGIVTLEDAIEALLGMEIVDETDEVADLQALARQRGNPSAPSKPQ